MLIVGIVQEVTFVLPPPTRMTGSGPVFGYCISDEGFMPSGKTLCGVG